MAALMHRWFVQYNPLYLASAFCVLGGVFLLTRDPAEWDRGQLALAAVIQLYELALVVGAAFLFGLPGQRRPAVILGIMAGVFLFDATFRTEALASVGTHMLAASLAWAMLLAAKLTMLGHALRVRLPFAHCALWTLAGLVLALGPQLIAVGLAGATAVLSVAGWLGLALVAVALRRAPRVEARAPLDDWGRVVLGRVARLMPMLWAALYWAHVLAWCGIHDLSLAAAWLAPLLFLLPFALRALPATAAQWGAALLGAGFASLAAGVALNWWSARGHGGKGQDRLDSGGGKLRLPAH